MIKTLLRSSLPLPSARHPPTTSSSSSLYSVGYRRFLSAFVQLVLVPQGGSQLFFSLLFLLPLAPHLIHLFSRRFLLHQEFILWKGGRNFFFFFFIGSSSSSSSSPESAQCNLPDVGHASLNRFAWIKWNKRLTERRWWWGDKMGENLVRYI